MSRLRDDTADLSELTNLRLNNRRARQRFVKEVLGDARQAQDGMDTIDKFESVLDDDTISPFKSERNYSRRQRSPVRSRRLVGASQSLDNSILDDDNMRYLDDNSYHRDVVKNSQKRERFLKDIVVPSPDAQKSFRSFDTYKSEDRDKKFSKANLAFKPRGIPDLQPEKKDGYDFSPLASKSHSRVLADRSNNKTSEENDFDYLVKKYNLRNETEMTQQNRNSEMERLKSKVNEMEDQMEVYQRKLMNSRTSTEESDELYKKNLELSSQVSELKQFIKFLDNNFSEMYKKWKADREEKERLQKLVASMKKLEFSPSPTKAIKPKPFHISPVNRRLPRPELEDTENLLKTTLI